MKKINFIPESSWYRAQDVLCGVCKHPIGDGCKPDYYCEAYLAVKKAIEEVQ